jgi:hypothetical protein
LTSADCVGADTALAFDLTSFATFAVVATLFSVCFFTAVLDLWVSPWFVQYTINIRSILINQEKT